jgi:hypothetical protein
MDAFLSLARSDDHRSCSSAFLRVNGGQADSAELLPHAMAQSSADSQFLCRKAAHETKAFPPEARKNARQMTKPPNWNTG